LSVLEARGLSVGYLQPVLRDISFSVGPGEFVGLLGANGAGKSTLLMTLAGHLQPLAGEALIGGSGIRKLSPRHVARLLAFLPQHPGADGEFTVQQLVDMGRHPYQRGLGLYRNQEDIAAVGHAMRVTSIESLASHRMERLSGGQRQRVRLAQAIAQEPRILLLDEPTSWLDLRYQLELMGLLRHLAREEGVAIVAVLHDLNQAAQFCTRLVLLANGGLLADGVPGEVLTAEALRKAYGVHAIVQAHPHLAVPVVMPLESLGSNGG